MRGKVNKNWYLVIKNGGSTNDKFVKASTCNYFSFLRKEVFFKEKGKRLIKLL